MFSKSADLYDLLYTAKDYAGEVSLVEELVLEAKRSPGRSLLDVACGTGRHLELLSRRFAVEGLDLNPDLLEVAAQRLPAISMHLGDMRSFDLGKSFDVVTCLFSSVGYMRTKADLRRAISTMAAHLVPGGVLVVEPFLFRETLRNRHPSALLAEDGTRKVARLSVTQISARRCVWNFHYALASEEGVQHFTERHVFGLFDEEDYVEAFERAGMNVEFHLPGLTGRGIFVGVRTAA